MNGRVCDNVSTEVVRRQVNEEVKDIIVSSNIYSQQSFNAAKTAMSYQILRFGLKMVHETLERSEITATTKTVQILETGLKWHSPSSLFKLRITALRMIMFANNFERQSYSHEVSLNAV